MPKEPRVPRAQIHDTNLANQVHTSLREMILNAEFAPGEKINIDEISQRLNVSKTPTREALRTLEEEQLVVYTPRKGYFVRYIDKKEIEEIIELRMLLEEYSIIKGFSSYDKRRIKKLHEAAVRDYSEFEKSNEPLNINTKYLESDFALHLEIVRGADNDRLLEFYISLKDSMDRVRMTQGRHIGSTFDMHSGLVEAIIDNDIEKALQNLRTVFETIRRELITD